MAQEVYTAEQIRRMIWLHQQIAAGRYPSIQDHMDQFEVSQATAYKDLALLRDEFGAPVKLDRERGGYYYTETFELPAVSLTNGELLSIVVLENILKHYETTPFYLQLERAFKKITASLQDEVVVNLQSLIDTLDFRISPEPEVNLTIYAVLLSAIRNREWIRIHYFSGQKAMITIKHMAPYHLLNYKGNWYLVGYNLEKQDIRDFLVNRIMKVERTGEHFEPDPSFDLKQHQEKSVLLGGNAREQIVEVLFDKFASHWVRIENLHHTKEIIEQDDGTVIVRLKVTSLENVLRWVLSFGEHCRVLKPAHLRNKVYRTIRRMRKVYDTRQFILPDYATVEPSPTAKSNSDQPTAATTSPAPHAHSAGPVRGHR